MSEATKGRESKRKKKVVIDGKEYPSITEAMGELHICTRKIYKILKETNQYV